MYCTLYLFNHIFSNSNSNLYYYCTLKLYFCEGNTNYSGILIFVTTYFQRTYIHMLSIIIYACLLEIITLINSIYQRIKIYFEKKYLNYDECSVDGS